MSEAPQCFIVFVVNKWLNSPPEDCRGLARRDWSEMILVALAEFDMPGS